ncbi:MAG: ATP-binding protein [Acidimicrobiales bacterium]
MTRKNTAQEHLEKQRDYVKKRQLENQKKAAANSGSAGLVDEKMLAETMRSVRYRDEAHAAGDLIDNAIESGATQVHLAFKTNGNVIEEVAFIDDGSGIDATFLPHATKWGGSSNEGQRNTFGRFGFGLSSASVNRGRAYDVISRTNPGGFKKVTVDLDNLSQVGGLVELPEVNDGDLPDWVVDYIERGASDEHEAFEGGVDAVRTVVIWRKLDRLNWHKRPQASAKYREHLGITYASWLGVIRLVVEGARVEPVDVLFTTPGHRWFEIDDYPGADPQTSIEFDVPDANGQKHPVKVRFSYLSVPAYNALALPSGRGRPSKVRANVRKNNNGVFVTRNGRFIELVKTDVISWNNYMRQVGVALDFPPALDEVFGVTPDKQTIVFNERVEDLLRTHGVVRAMNSLRDQVGAERKLDDISDDAIPDEADENTQRPSEKVIAKVVERDFRSARKESDEARAEAARNLRRRVKEAAAETGLPEEDIEEAIVARQQKRPYRVEFINQTADEAFYTPYMDGSQLVVRVNTAHPWYREVYSRLDAGQAEIRSGLELTLFVLGMSEIDSTGEMRIFYRSERLEWSRKLADAFDLHPLVFNEADSLEDAREFDEGPWVEDEEDDEQPAEKGADTGAG